MAAELIIRPARIVEQSELESLQLRASLMWEAYREALLTHPDAVKLPIEHIDDRRAHVAERGGKIVGFMVVLPRIDGDADLDGLFVEPETWKTGIGTRLVREAERWAADEGAVSLHVVASPQAVGFYAACGFDLVGEKQTRFGMALFMRKTLVAL
jgi:GNAT superfamily N-acetyltransferase